MELTILGAIMIGATLLFYYKMFSMKPKEVCSDIELNETSVDNPNSGKLHEQQLFLRNRMELGNGENPKNELPSSADLLLMSVIDNLKLVDMGNAKKMTIKCGSTQKEISDEYEILSFDIREFVKSQPEGKSVKSILFHIEFENVDVVLTLLASGNYSNNSRYFRMCTYTLPDTGEYRSYESLIEVRFSDSNQDYWEAKYMIDEAKAELEGENKGYLTNKTVATLSAVNPSMSYDLYWGRKYYNVAISSDDKKGFVYQALFHLYRVDDYFRSNLDDLNEEGRNAFTEINLYIGHLLMLNGEPAKAFTYLDLGRRTNTVTADAMYVDCLCVLKHPYAEGVIKDILARLLQQINETERADNLVEFNRFLNRRLVYVYKLKSRYADAELILNRMLANGEDDPRYIKAELAEINKEKEQSNQGDAQSAES